MDRNRVDGLIVKTAAHPVAETIERAKRELQAAGNVIFACIDHALGAEEAGLQLRPMQVIVWGNAHVGTPWMIAAPTFGIDLPQKLLVWEDGGSVYLAYNSLAYLARRHGATELVTALEAIDARVDTLMAKIAS